MHGYETSAGTVETLGNSDAVLFIKITLFEPSGEFVIFMNEFNSRRVS